MKTQRIYSRERKRKLIKSISKFMVSNMRIERKCNTPFGQRLICERASCMIMLWGLYKPDEITLAE